MKHSLRYLLPMLGLAVAWPALRAADDDKPAPKEEKKQIRILAAKDEDSSGGGPRIQHRVVVGHPGEKESVTFLGVETAPVSAALTAQLELAAGTGLVVVHLVPDSPAAGALKENDILLKLDDQQLIEQRQLSVLVRNHRDGDEVTITYLRAGKQSTAKVKLARHEVPKMAMWSNAGGSGFNLGGGGFGPGLPAGDFDLMVPGPNSPQENEMFRRVLPLMDGVDAPGMRRFQFSHPGGPGDRNISVTVNTGNSHLVLDDDKGSIELTMKDGKKDLVAKNAKGEQIFSGPVNTPEERQALPGEVRERLDRLEDSTQFNFKPDVNFKTETKIVHPHGQGIALPPKPALPVRPPLFF